jgi:hypothetical protein
MCVESAVDLYPCMPIILQGMRRYRASSGLARMCLTPEKRAPLRAVSIDMRPFDYGKVFVWNSFCITEFADDFFQAEGHGDEQDDEDG